MAATLIRYVKVINSEGLHMRSCLAVVNAVKRHQVKMQVYKGSQSADASSILELLSLAAGPGLELQLCATGTGAELALDAVADLFASGFASA